MQTPDIHQIHHHHPQLRNSSWIRPPSLAVRSGSLEAPLPHIQRIQQCRRAGSRSDLVKDLDFISQLRTGKPTSSIPWDTGAPALAGCPEEPCPAHPGAPGKVVDPQSPISQPSAYPEATPPQGSINVLYSPLRWHRSAGRKDERASASIPSLPHPPAEPQRLLPGSGLGGHRHSQGQHLPYPSTFHHPASARPVGSFQVEPWLQPFGMSHP